MLKIETGNKNKILRTVSEEIKKSELNKYVKLGKEMVKYIKNKDNGGVGLAAPQVGYTKRLIVVSLPKTWDDKNYKTIMMLNPEILEFSKENQVDEEGCLSVPSKKGNVKRAKTIKLKFYDDKMKINTLILEGLRARIVQHEIDHLDGILFTDKLEN